MISYFDELKFEGEIIGELKGKIKDICSFVRREFDVCPPELREKCARFNDLAVLERIWNFALFKAQSLTELMDFVDSQADEVRVVVRDGS